MSDINLDLRAPITVAVSGCCVLIGGIVTSIPWLKWLGVGLALDGMTITGTRLYKRMKIKGVNRV